VEVNVGADGFNVVVEVDRFCGVVAGAEKFCVVDVLPFTGTGCVVLLDE